MPLATIGKVLASEPEDAAKLVAEYERSFSARVVGAHRAIRDVLSGLRNKEAAMPYEVAVKELDPQLMVSKTSRTRITELEETMASSLSSLREFAARQSGEITGRPVGIYHGPINEEADGPIEVCLPVSGAFSPTGDIVVRELEGGNAAQASVHGDECKFPAILKAYDAAVDWIAQHGYESAGPPMELWPDEPGQMERITVVWPFAKPR
jgi:effector-binding domain-containing protein